MNLIICKFRQRRTLYVLGQLPALRYFGKMQRFSMVCGTHDLSQPLSFYENLDGLYARMTQYVGKCVEHFTRKDIGIINEEIAGPQDIGVDSTNLLIYCTNGRTRSIVIALGVLKCLQREYNFDEEVDKMVARFEARELLKNQWAFKYQNFRMMDKNKILDYRHFIDGLSLDS